MCFPSLFIQTVVEIYRSKSKAQKLFFAVFIYRVLNFLGLKDFPTLELVHIIDPIGATFLKQQQAQMKSAEPSTRTSKRSKGEATTAAPASSAWRVFYCSCIPTTFFSGLFTAWRAAERFYAEGFGFLFDNTSCVVFVFASLFP